MLVKIIKKYQDSETGRLHEVGDIKDVGEGRGQVLLVAGVAEKYVPKAEKNKSKPKGESQNEE